MTSLKSDAVTLNKAWNDFRGQIAQQHGAKTLESYKYLFYAGAASYHNILQRVSEWISGGEDPSLAALVVDTVSKELQEYMRRAG